MSTGSSALGIAALVTGIVASDLVCAEARRPWLDPPSDTELVKSMHARITNTVTPMADSPLPARHDAGAASMPSDAGPAQNERGSVTTPAAVSPAPRSVREAPAVEPRQKVRKARTAHRRALRWRTQVQPFARVFGPPRPNANVITTTHNK
jgi:hypothetical protein